jgi:hypothetical protein
MSTIIYEKIAGFFVSGAGESFVVGDIGIFSKLSTMEGWLPLDGSIYNFGVYPSLEELYPSWTNVPEVTIQHVEEVGIVRDVDHDENYIYIAHSASPYLTVLNRSDFSVVLGTPTLPNPGYSVYSDGNYLYAGNIAVWSGGVWSGEPYFTVYDKTTWLAVPDTPVMPTYGEDSGAVAAISADENYIYIGHGFLNGLYVVDKTDWSLVSGTPNIGGVRPTCTAVPNDASRVYVGHSTGITIVNKSDWSVAGSVTNIGSVRGAVIDDDYIYAVTDEYPHFYKIDKNDFSVVTTNLALSSTGNAIEVDFDNIYIGTFDDPYIEAYKKIDNTATPLDVAVSSTSSVYAIKLIDNFLYVGSASGLTFATYSVSYSGLVVPDVLPSITGAEYRVKAEES